MSRDRPLHPAIGDLHSDMSHGRMSRREFLRLATLLGMTAAAATALAGCDSLAAASDTSVAATIQRGGTMKIGSAIQPIDHPARLSWIEGANQLRQVAEYFIHFDR